jgi:VanZ family protein
MPANPRRNALAALAIISALIWYGSAYPFHFVTPAGSAQPIVYLLATLSGPPDRVDLMINIFAYLPVGFFAVRLFRIDLGFVVGFLLATLLGGLLSTACEVTQFYVPGRVPSASDIYGNTIGTMLGALFGLGTAYLESSRDGWRWEPFPMLLLASWILYRLYPFIPVINVRAYASALSPLSETPFSVYDIVRYGATWLTIAAISETLGGRERTCLLYFSIAAFVFIARFVVTAQIIRPDEILSIGIGYVVWRWLLQFSARRRALLIVLPLFAFVLWWRLGSFNFQAATRTLGLEPFQSFSNGSMEVNLQNFLVKVFYYGMLVWLTSQAGLRLLTSTVLVMAFLLLTSVIELYEPFRSAEVTDAAIALVIGILISIANGRSHLLRSPDDPNFALARSKPDRSTA